jgi:hypothetical protein
MRERERERERMRERGNDRGCNERHYIHYYKRAGENHKISISELFLVGAACPSGKGTVIVR